MFDLKTCFLADINIPDIDKVEKSKSKKLMKIGSLWFFIQRTQSSTKIYEVQTKKLIMAPGNYAKGLNLLVGNISDVEEAVESYIKECPWLKKKWIFSSTKPE